MVSGLCRLCAMLLVSSSSATFRICSEKFQTLSKAQKLILVLVVSVTLYISHLCGLGHSMAPSGTMFFLSYIEFMSITGPLQITSSGWAGVHRGDGFGVFDPVDGMSLSGVPVYKQRHTISDFKLFLFR